MKAKNNKRSKIARSNSRYINLLGKLALTKSDQARVIRKVAFENTWGLKQI